jgi:DNA repair exonuclease SbcCD nuclease subunit
MQDIKYLVISDIHLGNKRNKTKDIANNIMSFFKDYKELKDIDIIFIAGDLYDDLVDYSQEDSIHINNLLVWLVHFCQEHGIKLRVLEGTPSHDWKQSRVIGSFVKACRPEIDYRYIDDVYIETMQVKGRTIDILYVPDEIRSNGKQIHRYVTRVMEEKGLEQVDIAIMHGMFSYQLPNMMLPMKLSEEDFMPLVKYYIHIGHIHTPSNYGNIYAQGSFDRLRHGEEEDKGANLVTLGEKCSIEFLVNKEAKTFISLDVRGKADKIVEILDDKIKHLRPDSYIRLLMSESDAEVIDLNSLKKRYCDVNIEKKISDLNKFVSGIEDKYGIDIKYPVAIGTVVDQLKELDTDGTFTFAIDFANNVINENKAALEETSVVGQV